MIFIMIVITETQFIYAAVTAISRNIKTLNFRMNQTTRTMHHFNMMVPNMNQINMPKIPTEAM